MTWEVVHVKNVPQRHVLWFYRCGLILVMVRMVVRMMRVVTVMMVVIMIMVMGMVGMMVEVRWGNSDGENDGGDGDTGMG